MLWKEWNGYASVRAFDAHSESEYFAIRNKVGMIDVSPLCKHEILGIDAGVLLSRVFSRDAAGLAERRVAYGLLVDPDGYVLDDGTCAKLSPEHFRLCTSARWVGWLRRHARGLRVKIEDSTDRIAVLAVQGPLARDLLAPLVDFELGRMPFFRIRPTTLAGLDIELSRTGYTGDLGYELWIDAARAVALWDVLSEAGAPLQLTPFGLDALDVARIEAGFVLAGVDYFGAHTVEIAAQRSTPHELGLGRCVELERRIRFIGQDAIERELVRGPAWALVGLQLDGAELERLYAEHGLSPRFGPCASRSAVPVYAPDGRTHVGQATSHTWSPILKGYLALASVRAPFGQLGTQLRIEHTAEYERRTVTAQVVPRTFFDPPRKRTTRAPQQRAT